MGIITHQHKPAAVKVLLLLLLMVPATRTATGAAPGNWVYEKIAIDSVHTQLSTATLRSRNSIKLLSPYTGINHGLIMIRKFKNEEPEVLFAVDKGQLYTGDKIRIKIDGGDAQWIVVDKPIDRRTDLLFIAEPQNFINQITKAKELKITTRFFYNGEKSFNFTVDGLDMTKIGL